MVTKKIMRRVAYKTGHRTLKKALQFYLDHSSGDNNCDMANNGEASLLRRLNLGCNPVIFDVGAGVGDWAIEAKKAFPDSTIHCFEPSTERFTKLKRLIDWQITRSGIRAVNNGLAERSGIKEIHHDSIGGSVSVNSPGSGLTEQAYFSTIDEYCLHNRIDCIEYLKIDTEGHEIAVLSGAETMLYNEKIRYVQFEYGQNWIDSKVYLKDVFALAKKHGAKVFKILPDRLSKVERWSHDIETFKTSNWLIDFSTARACQ